MKTTPHIIVFDSKDDLFKFAASDLLKRTRAAKTNNDFFNIALSGGDTALLFFEAVVAIKHEILWDNIRFFFGDERYVPQYDKQSNFYNATIHLFKNLPIPKKNIYQIPTDFSDPQHAAKIYADILRSTLKIKNNHLPFFDVIYLGLGADGHTASLMPGSDVVTYYSDKMELHHQDPLVTSLWVSKLNSYRITLTPPIINNSNAIIFMVTGSRKQEAVYQVLKGITNPNCFPAQLITNTHQTLWLLDEEAAATINKAR